MSDQHRYTTAEYTYVGPGKGTVNLPYFDPEMDLDDSGEGGMDVRVMGYDTSTPIPVPDWPSDKSDPEGFIHLGKELFKSDDVNFSTSVTLENHIIDPMAFSGIRTYLIQIRGKDNALKEFKFVTGKNDQSKLIPGNGAAEKKQLKKYQDQVSENTGSLDQNNRTEAKSHEPSQAAQEDIPPKEEVSVSSSGSAPEHKDASAAATPAPASGGSSKIAMITAAAIAGIAVLGAGGWFILSMLNAKPEYRPCDLGEAGRTDSEIISGCLSSKPADADLQSLLAQSMKNGRCEIVLRLLRTKGRADDGGNYAYIYSVYADPSSQYSNECINKNDSDHQYWAQRVKDNKSFNPEAAQKVLEQIAQ